MCGIHVQITCTERSEAESHDHIESTVNKYIDQSDGLMSDWLQRRGPDASGRQVFLWTQQTAIDGSAPRPTTPFEQQQQQQSASPNPIPDDNLRIRSIHCQLQASVLSMRQALVRQPVVIPLFLSPDGDGEGDDNMQNDRREEQSNDNSHQNQKCISDQTASSNATVSTAATDAAFMAWNGEVYQVASCNTNTIPNMDGTAVPTDTVPVSGWNDVWMVDQSDTELVARLIDQYCLQCIVDRTKNGDHSLPNDHMQLVRFIQERLAWVLSCLVNAEFAVVLIIPALQVVLYARDPWGRRSLIIGQHQHYQQKQQQLPTSRKQQQQHIWECTSVAASANIHIQDTSQDWHDVEPGRVHVYQWNNSGKDAFPALAWTHPSIAQPERSSSLIPIVVDPVTKLDHLLLEAVHRRMAGPQPVAVLFSGGLDSVVLASMALQCISFDTGIVSDRKGVDSKRPLGDNINGWGSKNTQRVCDAVLSNALILINISFLDDEMETKSEAAMAADTKAAVASYHELQDQFPQCNIQLIQEQVTWSEISQHEERIRRLMFPKTTTMDLNIATALWFAARAASRCMMTTSTSCNEATQAISSSLSNNNNINNIDNSRCRILLSGVGADEQMGGYSRHRKAWQEGGEKRLRQELDLDMNRLWDRNFGRDDRILSDHGMETRYPYLDTAVVQFLSRLSLSTICDFSLPLGSGDKHILRQVAAQRGLFAASMAVKRAIQFGSRIAQVSDKRRFGSRRKATGKAASDKNFVQHDTRQ